MSSSSSSSKRKRGSDDEKTPRRFPNKDRPRRRRHGANIRITSYVTSITNPRGEQEDEPSPSSTQSSHDPISSAQVTEDLLSRVTRSQGPGSNAFATAKKNLETKIHPSKEGSDPASFKNSRLGASIDPYQKFSPKESESGSVRRGLSLRTEVSVRIVRSFS